MYIYIYTYMHDPIHTSVVSNACSGVYHVFTTALLLLYYCFTTARMHAQVCIIHTSVVSNACSGVYHVSSLW